MRRVIAKDWSQLMLEVQAESIAFPLANEELEAALASLSPRPMTEVDVDAAMRRILSVNPSEPERDESATRCTTVAQPARNQEVCAMAASTSSSASLQATSGTGAGDDSPSDRADDDRARTEDSRADLRTGRGSNQQWDTLELSENARRVLQARYLKKDEQGRCVESPEDLFRRVASAVADAELNYARDPGHRSEWEDRFFELMTSCRFMPNSPTLMNAGREMGMLSACFVLPVGDSIDEIFDAIKHTALIQKAGGGTGFAFDELRPTGDFIKSSGGTTSGPISFWRAFSEATNAIQQGAFRRGANMGMMYIDHPDILKFLHAKQDLSQFTNYNISIKVPDAWMRGLQTDGGSPHVVRNPRNGDRFLIPKDVDIWDYDVRALIPVDSDEPRVPAGREVYAKRQVWDIIIRNAWATGEPGVVFIDRINEANPTPHIGRIEATNPCGEQPLLPYEACNLGSVNLAKFVRGQGSEAEVDWQGLRQTIHESIRFLDNVIDVNRYPLPEIDSVCRSNRKIGLGIMGLADALFRLGVPYDSELGVACAERFMQFLNEEAHAASGALAECRGSFPNWEGSTWDTRYDRPMRNACCTTVAPTGTISIIADCSCGIEPLFALVFRRNVLKGQDDDGRAMIEVNPIFEEAVRDLGMLSEGLMERISRDHTVANVTGLPESLRRVFVCAHDIAPEWHVRMQAAFQKHCDSSVSKTINLPNEARFEDVIKVFQMSYELGCNGVTIYRDGCRAEQPMIHAQDAKTCSAAAEAMRSEKGRNAALGVPSEARPAAELMAGMRLRRMTQFGDLDVHVCVDPATSRELEVFARLGKEGEAASIDLEAICREASLRLQAGESLSQVIRLLENAGALGLAPTSPIVSLNHCLARILGEYIIMKEQFGLRNLPVNDISLTKPDWKLSEQHRVSGLQDDQTDPIRVCGEDSEAGVTERSTVDAPGRFTICSECRQPLTYHEGCMSCQTCGWTRC